MIRHCSFLYVLWIFSVVAGGESPTCRATNNGVVCKASDDNFTPYSMRLANDEVSATTYLVVGARNFLHSFTTDNLGLLQTVDLSPSENSTKECVAQQSVEKFCVNSITLVQQIPQALLSANAMLYNNTNTILACGTNAFAPRCTIHNLSNFSDHFYLGGDRNLGFSPFSTEWSNKGVLSSNGAFYAATNFAEHDELTRLAVSIDPLSGDTSFVAASNDRNRFWVSNTDFVSLHELDDHVYIFGREDSSEVLEAPRIKFGRVMRICKSDQGIEDDGDGIPIFKTFQKIRIACPNVVDHSFPKFYYNNLQSTYLHTGTDGSHWLYATFIAQVNGPSGSAICKFSFDPDEDSSLSNVFSTEAEYYKSDGTYTNVMSFDPFVCPGTDRSLIESTDYQLIKGVALPIGGRAVYTVNRQSYIDISVDVYEFGTSTYEVMFVTTKRMTIEAICYKDNQLVFTHTVAQYEQMISNLILDKTDSTKGLRKIYISGENFIANVVLGDCGKYLNCKECLESNDPYCAWLNNTSQLCINKLVDNYDMQIVEASEANVNSCPAVSPAMSTNALDSVSMPHSRNPEPSRLASITTITKSSSTPRKQCTVSGVSDRTKTSTTTITESSTILAVSIEPSIVPIEGQTSLKEIGEIIGVGIGGLILGVFVGILLCLLRVMVKNSVSSKPTTDHDHYRSTESTLVSLHQNGSSHSLPTVEQYKIPVSLRTEKNSDGAYIHSPVPPSISPPVVDDSELEDDVISDLPSNGLPGNSGGKIKKWAIPKGRTPSTRWLRASESSNAESESPVSPM